MDNIDRIECWEPDRGENKGEHHEKDSDLDIDYGGKQKNYDSSQRYRQNIHGREGYRCLDKA